LIKISKEGKEQIQQMKKIVFDYAENNFNLDFQMTGLIEKDVF